jgi:Fic family protein
MLIPPKYTLTPKISKLLSLIEANKEVVDAITIPIKIEQNIRRKSILKSSLFSARIEGNNATLDSFPKLSPKDKKRIEVNNILRAINWIIESKTKDITSKEILFLHSLVLKNIEYQEDLGKFRIKHEGIFNSAGMVVYHAPPPNMILGLIYKLLSYVNLKDNEHPAPIKAVLAHYTFEKIHPFTDGSGRVGRLLVYLMLKNEGYGFKGILPFEEKIDLKRDLYYETLSIPEKDVTSYIEFMLETIKDASNETKELILSKQKIEDEDLLLPRRGEILRILKEHKVMNFDSIKRRFSQVNERTLRYDLKKLQDAKFIQKLGNTRGVYYKANI